MSQQSLVSLPDELSLTQAAKATGRDRAGLWHHIINKNLRARQVGHAWIIRADDLRRFVAVYGRGGK